jgi:hypothetical protein
MTLTPEQIETAVRWWCQQIKAPVFDMLGSTPGVDRDSTEIANLYEPIAMVLSVSLPVSDEAVQRFNDLLRQKLTNDAPRWGGLGCDYGLTQDTKPRPAACRPGAPGIVMFASLDSAFRFIRRNHVKGRHGKSGVAPEQSIPTRGFTFPH